MGVVRSRLMSSRSRPGELGRSAPPPEEELSCWLWAWQGEELSPDRRDPVQSIESFTNIIRYIESVLDSSQFCGSGCDQPTFFLHYTSFGKYNSMGTLTRSTSGFIEIWTVGLRIPTQIRNNVHSFIYKDYI